MSNILLKTLLLTSALVIAGCSSDPATTPSSASSLSSSTGASSSVGTNSLKYFNETVGDSVFFETDSSTLSSEAQATLQRQAQWLKINKATKIVVEGHADERGTREYNIALGARRAAATRSFLQNLGVESSRLKTVSYGKERPVDACSSETCWTVNRRSVSVVEGAPQS
jgi:peptidoglycan-associated lipoprotein